MFFPVQLEASVSSLSFHRVVTMLGAAALCNLPRSTHQWKLSAISPSARSGQGGPCSATCFLHLDFLTLRPQLFDFFSVLAPMSVDACS